MNEGNLFASFEIDSGGTRITIEPVKLIERSELSLDALNNPRLFESRHQALSAVTTNQACTLLARSREGDSRTTKLVLIERLDESLYCVHQCLQNHAHVLERDIEPLSCDQATQIFPTLPIFASDDWWSPYEAEKHLLAVHDGHDIQLDLGIQPSSVGESITNEVQTHLIFEELKEAFLDMLYLSRASLVVFTKNTLAKLRSRVNALPLTQYEYADFIMLHAIPSFTDFDMKYKNWMPALIAATLAGGTYESKDLPSGEINAITQWLDKLRTELVPYTAEHICAKMLPSIKAREYQLLILLLLEVLVIEQDAGHQTKDVVPRKLQQDPSLLIEVMLDRLAISQSLNFTQDGDLLQTFCLEVLNPFYSGKLGELMQSISQKCLPEDDFSSHMPTTPAKASKTRGKRQIAQKTSNTASLKRTRSAPANLLSEKRVALKKRNLGREVSMTKRAPSFEINAVKPAYTKTSATFEERRKLKIETESQEKVQVGQTPAKNRSHNVIEVMQQSHNLQSQIEISKHSKASFMAVGETPVKQHHATNVTETPVQSLQTPKRSHSRVFDAPSDGIQDTPTGRSILFKLDSPKLTRHTRQQIDPTLDCSPESFRKPPSIRKSVTFSGSFGQESRSSGQLLSSNISRSEDAIDDFFGPEIATPRAGESPLQSLSKESTDAGAAREGDTSVPESLEAALDWL